MSYTINNADGSTLITIPDTQINTQYGITLIGRNYSGYGVFLNDNFVVLMENFANSSAPANPLTGQLWFNTNTKMMQTWQGSQWKILAYTTVSGTAPAASQGTMVGDLWWDTFNQQLNVWGGQTVYAGNVAVTSTGNIVTVNFSTAGITAGYQLVHANINPFNQPVVTQVLNSTQLALNANIWVSITEPISFVNGAGWNTIGPAYTKSQGLTGVLSETIIDTMSVAHSVGIMYNNGVASAVLSGDATFTPAATNAIPGFPTISPGVQTRAVSSTQTTRTVAQNASGSAGTTQIQLVRIAGINVGDYFVSSIDNGNISVAVGTAQVTGLFTSNNTITINTATVVYAGNVVTFQRGTLPVGQFIGTATNALQFDGTTPDHYSRLDRNNIFNANIEIQGNLQVDSAIQTNQTVLSIANFQSAGNINFLVNANNYAGNVGFIQANTAVMTINGSWGNVSVAMDPMTDLDVATRRYVNNSQGIALAALTANVNALVGTTASLINFSQVSAAANSLSTSLATLSADESLKAYALNAALTGIPTAPTATAGTSTGQIATTQFVTSAVTVLRNSVNDTLTTTYAPLVSPALTGVPTAPTVPAGDNTISIATTAFVTTAISTLASTVNSTLTNYAQLAGAAFTGVVTGITQAPGDTSTKFATTAFVSNAVITANTAAFANLATTNSTLNTLAQNVSTNYAPLVSPNLTGSPTSVTMPIIASNTAIATTAFVQNFFTATVPGTYAPLASPVLIGTPKSPNVAVGTNTAQIATTAFVQAQLSASLTGIYAPLSSPAFTGSATATTMPIGTANTAIATTQFVQNQLAASIPVTSVAGRTGSITLAVSDIAGAAPLAGPIFTGTPTAPNPTTGDSTTRIATTQFVTQAITAAQSSASTLWQGSAKFVSTSAPNSGQGNIGDIWFQI
jgi:hypothetical protein